MLGSILNPLGSLSWVAKSCQKRLRERRLNGRRKQVDVVMTFILMMLREELFYIENACEQKTLQQDTHTCFCEDSFEQLTCTERRHVTHEYDSQQQTILTSSVVLSSICWSFCSVQIDSERMFKSNVSRYAFATEN